MNAPFTPLNELVNAQEFEEAAQRKLDSFTFAEIAGSDRRAFDRITLRPRMMVDTRKLNLAVTLLGQEIFTPILAGPIGRLKRFHPEGELAAARGSSAAKAVMIVSRDSDYPVNQIAAQTKMPLWFQVDLQPDMDRVRPDIERAAGAGCKVLVITLTAEQAEWNAIDSLRKGIHMPLVLKGVMSAAEARKAIAMGAEGIVLSNYSARPIAGIASPMEVLPAVAVEVGGRIPILIDGSFRRGSDVLMALAMGAQAVLLGRPVVWGLAAYGDRGVQSVIELIQSEFARDMAMCGKLDVKALDKSVIRVHRR